jgi:glycine/D-amino acid oxidase-like deaminating enzyme
MKMPKNTIAPALSALPIWLTEPALTGQTQQPTEGGILIIGSGLTGVSVAYWLEKYGFGDIKIIDYLPESAASFRNCGHILHGTVESMGALVALHGREKAKEIWSFSVEICEQVKNTILSLGIAADYRQDGYLVIAVDEVEHQEIISSSELLDNMGFQSQLISCRDLEALGFRNVFGGRYEPGSAQAHPVKFRNGLLQECLKKGISYQSGSQVSSVEESAENVVVVINGKPTCYDAVVIAANAYSPLLSRFFLEHRLIEPFRGQIIASKPLKAKLPVSYPHSFDRGYEYAIASGDNRLLLGGWRNATAGGEKGSYELSSNPEIDIGLKQFATDHYGLTESLTWEHSWTGIMGASRTGFPFIGPTDQLRVFTCSGYTGHGFSWAHGSAKLLADIMAGNTLAPVARFFNPRII